MQNLRMIIGDGLEILELTKIDDRGEIFYILLGLGWRGVGLCYRKIYSEEWVKCGGKARGTVSVPLFYFFPCGWRIQFKGACDILTCCTGSYYCCLSFEDIYYEILCEI
jgi:hypothetical protein